MKDANCKMQNGARARAGLPSFLNSHFSFLIPAFYFSSFTYTFLKYSLLPWCCSSIWPVG